MKKMKYLIVIPCLLFIVFQIKDYINNEESFYTSLMVIATHILLMTNLIFIKRE